MCREFRTVLFRVLVMCKYLFKNVTVIEDCSNHVYCMNENAELFFAAIKYSYIILSLENVITTYILCL
jgi:hypothetical protein